MAKYLEVYPSWQVVVSKYNGTLLLLKDKPFLMPGTIVYRGVSHVFAAMLTSVHPI